MTTAGNAGVPLDETPANRTLVEALFTEGLLTRQAREAALDILHPRPGWGPWAASVLTAVGAALVLSGVIFFFAFNWAKLTPFMKFGLVEFALAACLTGAGVLGLQRAAGRMLLLSAAALVGVFWAVFGQVYQTGADAWTLFLTWSAMTLGFALIGDFAPLWALWLAVANTFLALFWSAEVNPPPAAETAIFTLLALFNLAFLGLREALVARGAAWLADTWTRAVLVATVLGLIFVPTLEFVLSAGRDPAALVTGAGALLGLIVHAGFFAFYRSRACDAWAVGLVFLSGSAIAEGALYRAFAEIFPSTWGGAPYFLFSLATIALFAGVIALLRAAFKTMETPLG